MKLLSPLSMVLFLSLVFLTSCDKDDPVPIDEPELITTLIYTLTPIDGGTPAVLSFQDLDGDGGDEPVVTTDNLMANTTYNGSISLLNETETPAENISAEVLEEGAEHQFFFAQTVNGISLAYTDMDEDGNPIGLSTILTTTVAQSGNFTIILRHEPDKNADGAAQGNINNAGGETDIEVTFPINVQ